jgi:hypothetical protein
MSPSSPKFGFKAAAKPQARATRIPANIPERLQHAIARLEARHEINRPRQEAQNYIKLLRMVDRAAPVLKPSWARDNSRPWLVSAAKYYVARCHALRIEKLRAVADRMQAKENGHEHRRDERER